MSPTRPPVAKMIIETRTVPEIDIHAHILTAVADLTVLFRTASTMDEMENSPANQEVIKLTSTAVNRVCNVLSSARLIVNGPESTQRSNRAATTVATFSRMVVTLKTILDTDVLIIGCWDQSRLALRCIST
jgi:hypothetical protein